MMKNKWTPPLNNLPVLRATVGEIEVVIGSHCTTDTLPID